MLVCCFSFRSHKTWGEKVSGKNWPGQPDQHRHVQETSLPGGNRSLLMCLVCTELQYRRDFFIRIGLLLLRVCVTGVCVPGVQGDDAGDGGGRVRWVEAAGGRGGGRHEGERLQTGVQQQTTLRLSRCVDQTSAFKAKFALICDIKTLFNHRNTAGFFLPALNDVMSGKKIWGLIHTEG